MSNQVYSNLSTRAKYSLTGLVSENPEDGITTINGDLLLPDLDYDVLNDDVITIDPIGVLYKTEKQNLLINTEAIIKNIEYYEDPTTNNSNTQILSMNSITKKTELIDKGSLPGGNPFDQDLNTTDKPEFNKLGINMPVSDGSTDLAVLKLRNIVSPNASSWGCRSEYYITGVSNDNRPYMTINVSREYDQNLTFGTYWDGVSWKSSTDLSSFKWQRAGDNFNFAVSTGAQIKGDTVIGEKSPVYIKAHSDIGLYIDGSQDGGLYLRFADLVTTFSRLVIWDGTDGGKLKTMDVSDLNIYDQDLNTTDDVVFHELTVSDNPPLTTVGYDNFRFIAEENFSSGNWGARQSFYLDNIGVLESTLPHLGVALSSREDCNITFMQYFTQESPFGWKFSETNHDAFRIHYQDYNPSLRGLNFYANTSQGAAGTVISEEIVMSIRSGLYGLGVHISPENTNSALYIDNITSGSSNTRLLSLDNVGKVQEISKTQLYGQDLSTTSDVVFNDLTINGNLKATNIPVQNGLNNLLTLDSFDNVEQSGITCTTDNSLIVPNKITCTTSQILPEIGINVLIAKDLTDELKEIDIVDLFEQNLYPNSIVEHASISTTTSTTNTLNLLGAQAQDNELYNILAVSGTGEVKVNDMTPKYSYSLFEDNVNKTLTTTLNTWAQVVYPSTAFNITGTGLFSITNDAGFLKYTYNELDKIVVMIIDFDIFKDGGGNALYQFETQLNGVKIGASPKQKLEDNTKFQMLSTSGIVPLTSGDVITFWVKCVNNTDAMTINGFNISAHSL